MGSKLPEGPLHQEQPSADRLLEHSSDVIAIFEVDGRVRYLSPAAERLFGYKPEERIGADGFENVHPEDVAWIKRLIQERMDTPGPAGPVVYRVRRKDERWIEVEVMANNLLHDPAVQGIVVNMRDVSQRRAVEADRERLIFELQEALSRVKALSGLLPICSWCKKIRDDSGHWNQLEAYLRAHSGVEFTHCICPDCARKLKHEN